MAEVPEISPRETWDALRAQPEAALVDVRTDAEWSFVGLPDLIDARKQPVLAPWQLYPSMQRNAEFLEDLRRAGLTRSHRLYFICRSGARSLAAAQAAWEAGYPLVFNVTDGFEGPVDAEGHRGTVAGWKAEGLPWRQR
jgi:rhodanese-related sulfurtransferase